jgi:hypothetical protein
VLEYNAGNIAADLRAELGGCGASMGKRTKDLIWFYHLHKKQTFDGAGDSDAGRYESCVSIDYTRATRWRW